FGVAILDADAERLSPPSAAQRAIDVGARLVCLVVYGQNPNSGTTNMVGAIEFAQALRERDPSARIAIVGSHASALPRQVLNYECVDIVLLNEGVYAIHNLLRSDLDSDLGKIRGIGHKSGGIPQLNEPERVVPNDRMDFDLPGYAWDLLPNKNSTLDLYRAHFWHTGYDHESRTPFAAIYSSLGCRYGCDFCMINIVNRVDNDDHVTSADSKGMRFWSPEFVLKELEKLAHLGVETVRISDEMFFLDRRYFEPLLNGIIERDLNFNMWAYARVDTVREKYLETFKKAGVNWLGLGVEAGNQTVRHEVSKGTFKDVNIREVVGRVRQADINVGANYIIGFPDDNKDTVKETVDLSLELCTEFANFYPCQALPGSPLHLQARVNGWQLPESFEGYAFLSYECQPLPTKHLTAAEVLKLRDEAWLKYFTHEPYLRLVESRFGAQQRKNVEEMTKIRLRRKLLGD
ncbi:MAG: B12-binding domain-containing radical SAM protein, partial [Actinomycetes bacterium]